MSTFHSETVEPCERSLTPSDEAYRGLLRAVLTSQVSFERAQNLRQTLLFALTATSLVLWALAAWPELLPVTVRSMSLGVWLLLFTAVLYTWVVELLWLRRSNHARRHRRAMAPPPAAKT